MNPFRRKGPSKAPKGISPWIGWAYALLERFKRGLKALAPMPGASLICLAGPEVPVVTSGIFNGHTFTEAVLRELVETYNFAAQPAPIKITHADKESPAAGWVKALRLGEFTPPGQTKPRKALLATLAPNDLGRAKVKSGEFLMRSIEAWPPTHPSNPTPGKWNFKALALLGTDSPACPNLGPLQLAENASEVEVPVLALGLDDEALPNPGGPQPPASQGAAMALTPEQQAALDKAAVTETALAEATKKTAELEARLAAQTLEHDNATVKLSLAELVKDSKLTPAQAEVLAPVLLALPAEGEVKLADGKSAKPREALLAVLAEGAAHGLKAPLKVPGKPPVELASKAKGDRSKEMAALVDKYESAGKTHADAVACAAQDLDNDGQ
ncbi:hypothetical protein [Geothrix fuzhouensis]|uniref:hypothetical protein n=1 Tax=Geothrix fuzhouensis TaxID=2966451 RepID=UPI00214804F3|nr:hypothetical protein [Geothrix fuzhouensis]